MKKVLINGLYLNEPFSGTGIYLYSYLDVFAQKMKDDDVEVLLMETKEKEQEDVMKQLKDWGYKYKKWRYPTFVPKFVQIAWWEYIALPRYLRKKQVDVYFSPYVHPLLWFPRSVKKYIFTLHDIFFWKYKDYQKKWTRKMYNWLCSKTICSKSTQIATVSQTSKKEIQEYFHLSKNIIVAPNGIDHLQKVPLLDKKLLTKQFGITKPYIFYLGGYDKRKNVQQVVETFLELRKTHDIQLVLGGNALYTSSLYSGLSSFSEIHQDIIVTGFVDSDSLRTLYHDATVFLMLSKDEGFNLNIGEALYENTKVVASEIPVHRELWKGWCILVDIKNQSEVTEEVKHILDGESQIQEMSSQEKEEYSWSLQVEKLLEHF